MSFSLADPPAVSAPPPVAQRPVTTGARTPDDEPVSTEPDLRCWAKFRRGPAPYNGEYGFDWMDWQRDPDPKNLNDDITKVMDVDIKEFDYCYDEQKREYVAVAADPHLKRKLQGEYRRVLVYGEDYYAGWLSVRPGQEVKLQLAIEALNSDPAKDDYLTFGPHASYQVTVNGQVNEAIRITPTAGTTAQNPQVVDVTIKNVKPCADTSLQVLDEKGKVVGQLNVVDNTKTYKLPVRVVYLIKDAVPQTAVSLQTLQTTFAALNLERYLNENSLNQAQIQVYFEKTSQVFQILFKEIEWSGKFYDSTNNWFTNCQVVVNGKTETTYFLDEVLKKYIDKYETVQTDFFKGIILVVTDIRKNPADKEGGISKVIPVNFREAVIYQTNLTSKESYAHEISHALGLEHSFWRDAEYKLQLKTIANNIDILESNIKSYKHNRKNVYSVNIKNHKNNIQSILDPDISQRKQQLNKYKDYFNNNPMEKTKAEDALKRVNEMRSKELEKIREQEKLSSENDKKQLKAEQQLLEFKKELLVYNKNAYMFKEGKTDNFMDYTSNGRKTYFHYQWQAMQSDVVEYYGTLE